MQCMYMEHGVSYLYRRRPVLEEFFVPVLDRWTRANYSGYQGLIAAGKTKLCLMVSSFHPQKMLYILHFVLRFTDHGV